MTIEIVCQETYNELLHEILSIFSFSFCIEFRKFKFFQMKAQVLQLLKQC